MITKIKDKPPNRVIESRGKIDRIAWRYMTSNAMMKANYYRVRSIKYWDLRTNTRRRGTSSRTQGSWLGNRACRS